jgi:hypothetical protein
MLRREPTARIDADDLPGYALPRLELRYLEVDARDSRDQREATNGYDGRLDLSEI